MLSPRSQLKFINRNLFSFRLVMQLFKPMVLEQGQRFTIRDGNTTLGTGVITKVMPKLSELERTLLLESKKNRDKIMAAQSEKKK